MRPIWVKEHNQGYSLQAAMRPVERATTSNLTGSNAASDIANSTKKNNNNKLK